MRFCLESQSFQEISCECELVIWFRNWNWNLNQKASILVCDKTVQMKVQLVSIYTASLCLSAIRIVSVTNKYRLDINFKFSRFEKWSEILPDIDPKYFQTVYNEIRKFHFPLSQTFQCYTRLYLTACLIILINTIKLHRRIRSKIFFFNNRTIDATVKMF